MIRNIILHEVIPNDWENHVQNVTVPEFSTFYKSMRPLSLNCAFKKKYSAYIFLGYYQQQKFLISVYYDFGTQYHNSNLI